jgi:sugar phosphate isomerase/epimerase
MLTIDNRLVSLAAGCALDATPEDLVEHAAAADFGAVGVWFDASTWTDQRANEVRRRLDATGVVALDIEPIILGRNADTGRRLIDAAAVVGARYALIASGMVEPAAVIDQVGSLAELATSVAPALQLVVEFLPIFSIASLADALAVARTIDRPNVGVLVDSLHLARSGGSPDSISATDRALLPYLQLADARASGPERADLAGLRDEALNGRLQLGDGALPLDELLDAVPSVPLSLELRSATLMTAYPEPRDRVASIADHTRQFAQRH